MFGAGGGTSSYEELANTDLLILWGSNARDAHPIMFHHMLSAKRRGAKMIVVDPRFSSTAVFGDLWLGLDVGSDIALANAVGREIIAQGWHNPEFIEHATEDFERYRASVEPYTLERAEEITGVPAAGIAELAHSYATAPTAEICWTLGITEHHTAVDNVFSLINLALLCGHVGRYGSGLCPLRGQNNVQGGGDMGALPNRLPGFQSVEDDTIRSRVEGIWGSSIPAKSGWHLSQMFEAMERRELRSLYVIGENPAASEANATHTRELLEGLDFLVVQDIYRTQTAELADVVLPAAACFTETAVDGMAGTVTNSERRVQLMHPSLRPPGEALDDISIVCRLANQMGADWGQPSAQEIWDELRQVSPMHTGMSYDRLQDLGGIRWPCADEDDPGSLFLHGRLWERPVTGLKAAFQPVEWRPPIDELTSEYPIRLTTGRRLDSYNTGVQTASFASPKRDSEALEISASDAQQLDLADGEMVQVFSRRGSITAPVRVADNLREGLAFLTLHFSDQVDTNILVPDDWDPLSGTSEFKATAIRIEKLVAS